MKTNKSQYVVRGAPKWLIGSGQWSNSGGFGAHLNFRYKSFLINGAFLREIAVNCLNGNQMQVQALVPKVEFIQIAKILIH